jgi:tetratricopeptide (TPR) repeat protein
MSISFIDNIRKNPWPYAIFAVAFLARLIYIIEKSFNDPAFAHPAVDELWNWRWAEEIRAVSFFGDDALFRAPLYAYFLAGMKSITEFLTPAGQPPATQLFVIRTLQAALAGVTALLVFRLGKETISERVGKFAGLAYGLYGTLIFYETMLLIPVLFLFLTIAATLQLVRWAKQPKLQTLIYSGLLFGLAGITRPNILLVMPLLAVYVFLRNDKHKPQASALAPRLKNVGILTLAVCIPVFSVTLRNKLVTDEATLIATQGGVNFYIGNNPAAEGLTMQMPELDLNNVSWSRFSPETKRVAEKESGRALTPAEQSAFWTAKATAYISSYPLDFLKLTLRKITYIGLGFENSDNGDIYYKRRQSLLLTALLSGKDSALKYPWALLFPLALLGMIIGWRKRRTLAPAYLIFFGYLPTIFLFLVTARHRLLLVPFVTLFGAVGFYYLYDIIKEGAMKRILLPGGATLGLMIVLSFLYFDIGFSNPAQIYQNQGIAYTRKGAWPQAAAAYSKAIEVDPNSYVNWNELGFALMSMDSVEQAGYCYDKSFELNPQYIEPLLNYGQMLSRLTAYDLALQRFEKAQEMAPNDFRPVINIGDVYLRQGEYDKAEEQYRHAKILAPEEKEVYFKLGELFARNKKFFSADQEFQRGAYYGKPSAIAYLNWANLSLERNLNEEAISKYRESLKLNPRLKQAWYGIGVSYFKMKAPPDSVRKYLQVALELDPNMEQAKQIMTLIGGR